MAITVLTNPQPYVSGQDSVWITAYSDNYQYDNMKYVFTIINKHTDEIIITTKIYPDISNGYGYYDLGPIVKNLFDYSWMQNQCQGDDVIEHRLVVAWNQGYIGVRVVVGEEYYLGQDLVRYMNLVSTEFYVYNYMPRIFERTLNTTLNTKLWNDFNIQNGTGLMWATNRPIGTHNTKIYISKYDHGDPLYIGLYANNFSGFGYAAFDKDGNQLAGSGMGYSSWPQGPDFDMFQLNITPRVIALLFGYDMMNSNTEYYEFWVGQKYTIEPIRVYMDCDEDQSAVQLHFMNAYGLFDTARFKCANRLNLNITRKSFEKKDVTFDYDMVRYGSSSAFNERKINFDGIISHTYKLTMDYISDAEYEWLAELIYSPQIYMYHLGIRYPVTIKNQDYEYVKSKNNQLRNLQIEVELNLNKNTFRR